MDKPKYLFKAISAGSGQWIRGGYVYCDLTDKHYIVAIRSDDRGNLSPKFTEVKPDTLCMCTGLYDKNRTLVFENDVLKGEVGKLEKFLKLVSLRNGTLYVTPSKYIGNNLDDFLYKDPLEAENYCKVEVIANIYDPDYTGKGRTI